jgi:hypothetical protein
MAARGEKKSPVLIVFLVIFILAALILGVTTYIGYDGQASREAAKKKADDDKTASENDSNWYQFQALQYRAWLGQTAGFNDPSDPKDEKSIKTDELLKSLRQQYDDGALGKDGKGQDLPDKPIVADIMKKVEGSDYLVMQARDKDGKAIPLTVLDKDGKPFPAQGDPVAVSLAWDKEKKRPKVNYEDVYWGLRSLLADRTHEVGVAKGLAQDKEREAADAKAELTKAQKEYADNVALLTQKNQADLGAAFKTVDDKIEVRLKDVQKEKDDLQAKADKTDQDAKAQLTKMAADLKDANDKLTDLKEKDAATEVKNLEAPSEGKPIPTDWKIVRMDRSGKQPFINLGRSAGVRPGLTFSIHGQGPDGRPIPASKGTLEVLNVVDDNLSQGQVVSVKDAFKDPILPGDFLYNPIFHPGGAQHVVIAGRIDMHGTKGDDVAEFKRLLDRQNVVVDGFVDLAGDGSLKGKLTVGTDYLVLGDITDLKDGLPAQKTIQDLQEAARRNGVRIVTARDFLDSMGYHTGGL